MSYVEDTLANLELNLFIYLPKNIVDIRDYWGCRLESNISTLEFRINVFLNFFQGLRCYYGLMI